MKKQFFFFFWHNPQPKKHLHCNQTTLSNFEQRKKLWFYIVCKLLACFHIRFDHSKPQKKCLFKNVDFGKENGLVKK